MPADAQRSYPELLPLAGFDLRMRGGFPINLYRFVNSQLAAS